MKHNRFLNESYLDIPYEEAKPLIDKTALQLSKAGISAIVNAVHGGYGKGLNIDFKFSKPIIGRDFSKARVECKGFAIFLRHEVGRDEYRDENGKPVFDKDTGTWKKIGEEYAQYSVQFRFAGNWWKFHSRKSCGIQPPIPYDYNDKLMEFDFGKNIDYLKTIA